MKADSETHASPIKNPSETLVGPNETIHFTTVTLLLDIEDRQ